MKSILLIGAGGHCKSVIEVIESENVWKIHGLIDQPEKVGQKLLNYSIIGSDKDLKVLIKECSSAIVCIGQIESPNIRREIYENLIKMGFNLPTILASSSIVSKYATIGSGTVVFHGAIVNANVRVGVNCIINSQALVEHDVHVGDHCHISTGSRINGGVQIGSGTFVGSGAIIREGLRIGDNAFIGMGVRVLKDVPNGARLV